ncbi:MAG: pyridoxal phosphate-dependent aminotransferase [Bacteroidetes bacterium]|nr:pyridoxal phosphate-dependent aminotransferase [Bacteroidota bacterium]
MYNFDEIIDRQGSHCVKIERMTEIWGRNDLLPLWVADMDFKTPPCIMDAIKERLKHEVLGYTCPHEGYYAAIIHWLHKRYGMEARKEQIQFVPGIVPGINMTLHALTQRGDRIIVQPPVYHPFRQVIEGSGRILVNNPLVLKEDRFYLDFAHLRKVIKGCKVLILCNPHNPGGRVWSVEEMETLAEICAKHGVMVLSDEIHADLTLPPHKHLPFAMVSPEAREASVTFMAPSKAFNMPGLVASHLVVYNDVLREKLFHYIRYNDLDLGNVFAFLGVEAAYNHGASWLEQLLVYIQSNIDFVDQYLQRSMPKIKAMRPQASYLLFLDCRELGFATPEALDHFFVAGAGLALNNGALFGEEGRGFMRMNTAAPRSVLERAMRQLEKAYNTLN